MASVDGLWNYPVDMKWYLLSWSYTGLEIPQYPRFCTKVVGPSQEVKALGSEKRMAERHQKDLILGTVTLST